jgi:hypothetical protein
MSYLAVGQFKNYVTLERGGGVVSLKRYFLLHRGGGVVVPTLHNA